jgi:hypothetical protein
VIEPISIANAAAQLVVAAIGEYRQRSIAASAEQGLALGGGALVVTAVGLAVLTNRIDALAARMAEIEGTVKTLEKRAIRLEDICVSSVATGLHRAFARVRRNLTQPAGGMPLVLENLADHETALLDGLADVEFFLQRRSGLDLAELVVEVRPLLRAVIAAGDLHVALLREAARPDEVQREAAQLYVGVLGIARTKLEALPGATKMMTSGMIQGARALGYTSPDLLRREWICELGPQVLLDRYLQPALSDQAS